MKAKDLVGKKIVDILLWINSRPDDLDEAEVFIKLDSGEMVGVPWSFDSKVEKEIDKAEVESLFFGMGRVLFTGQSGMRRRIELPYLELENQEIVDVLMIKDHHEPALLELANGSIITEITMFPTGAGRAGLCVFNSLEELESEYENVEYLRLLAESTQIERDRRQIHTKISDASDVVPAVITSLTKMVNAVYAEAEGPLWAVQQDRTSEDEIARLLLAKRLILAFLRQDLVGCIDVEFREDGAMFGMLVSDPDRRGLGIGSKLVAAAEDYAKSNGYQYIRLELLTPRSWKLEQKEFLLNWYNRLGYKKEYAADFAEKYPNDVHKLSTPCDFTVYCKKLE